MHYFKIKNLKFKIIKKLIFGVVSLLVIGGPLLYLTLLNSPTTQAAWYDDSWSYRKAINIATHNASENNVYINLTGADDIDTSDTARFQTDCGDLRFTDTGGKLLQYYIVSGCSSADTVVHVFFSTMPAGAQTVYYYYGNPTVQNGGNAADFATQASSYTFTTIGSEEKTPGPIAYWKFDDGTGTNTQDSTTNNNDGTISGATWQTEDQCISGKCLQFDGTDDYIDMGSSSILDNIPVKTVTFWTKLDAQTGISTASHFINKGDSSWFITTDPSNSRNIFGQNFSTTTGRWSYPQFSLNTWHHVAVVYDRTSTSNDPIIYVDGISQPITEYSTPSGTVADDSANSLLISKSPGYGHWVDGRIDEVKLYPYARTASQILTDYSSRGSVKGASAVIASDQRSNLANGLVGYWKMDESSGNRSDSSGNGNTLTDTATVTSNPGKFGNAGQFTSANSEYLSITDNASLSTGDIDFTIAGWVYLDTKTVSRGIITKFASTGDQREYQLVYSATADRFAFTTWGDGTDPSATTILANTLGVPSTGQWYFVVGWHDSVNNTVNIQVNNGAVDSAAHTFGGFDGSAPFAIGTRDGSLYWDGRIDEARFYKRALSSADRSALYNFAPGPVGYWNMDENQGTSANDKSDNGDTGTLTLGPTWKQGKYGSAVNFDGSDDYINITGNAVLRPSILTLSAWIKPSASISSGASEKVLIRYVGSSGLDRYGYQLSLSSNAGGNLGKLDFLVGKGTGGSGWNTYSSTKNSWNANQWYYVSVTTDGTNYRFYIDGIAENSGSVSTLYYDSIDSTAQVGGISTSGFTFSGPIDEVKIYSYARTSKQIVEDMNAGHPAVGSPVGSAVGHWKFDEGVDNTCSGGTNDTCNSGSGGSTLDGAGSGFSSPASATSGWTNSGKFGKALIFDGTDDYTSMGTATALKQAFSSITLSAWVNIPSYKDGANYGPRIISNTDGDGYAMGLKNGYILADLRLSGGNVTNAFTNTRVSLNTWTHLAITYDGSTITAYINGISIGTTPGSGTMKNTLNSSTCTFVGAEPSTCARTSDINENFDFIGSIDEPKVYSYALTTDELKIDMNRGSSQVLGSISDKTGAGYEGGRQAANQEYCVPGDSTSCAAPIAEWKLNEKQGITAYDTSGNGYNGTLTSTSTPLPSWIQGKSGSALSFDGTTNYLTTSTLGSFGSGLGSGGTLEFWINTTTTVTTRQIGVLNTGSATAFVVDFNRDKTLAASVGKTNFYIRDDSNLALNGEISTNIYDGKWHHVAWVISNPSSNSFKVYVDGAEQTVSYQNQQTPATFSNFGFPFIIGAVNNRGTPASFINAKFDQVKIFNYGRSAAQIAWDYNRGAPVGYWKFNECQGTTVYDDSRNATGTTNGNNGTITVGPSGTQTAVGTCTGSANTMWKDGATGKYNSSLDFDGTDDYVKISSNLAINSSFSVGAWVKPTSVTPSVRQIVIADRLNDAGVNTNTGFHLILTETTGIPSFALIANVGTSDTVPLSSGWHHLLGVYDSSAGTIKLYVDGILKNTTDGASLVTSNNPIRISHSIDGVGVLRYFDGQIDDTQIYNYALTATQVKTLYNQGAVRFGPTTGTP